ncbi:TraB/GumN family protein [Oleiagrimonas sp.]|jgi:uncharacterized protein YbaP (TraB family)|uniref:TraB/GumN family protein n=1 Tax=Oleiagrimonas sp. TaxID=2010330 RepID=UPI00262D0E29|nr:TraB/GumN family protein [Oleiagrimonas sp.]MDA3913023.1 TraB/GumN family protein [Oleiagrimonas sp.]
MHLLRRIGQCLGLALYLAAVPALATPALWVAHSGKSTVYLFGTMHILPKGTAWRSPTLTKALDASRTLYIEETDDSTAHMQALVLKYGIDPSHPLSGELSPGDVILLKRAVQVAGLPGGEATINIMRPWLAGLTLIATPLLKAGMDPKSGVDKQLKAQFKSEGKPVKGLETAEQQIRFLAGMKPKTEIAFLHSILKHFKNATSEVHKLIDHWQTGNVEAIAKSADIEMRTESPELYQRLIVARNKAWARQLAALMKTPGTRFVAVGAAHLAGPDSVQKQLQAFGIITRRIQ